MVLMELWYLPPYDMFEREVLITKPWTSKVIPPAASVQAGFEP